MSQGAAGGLIMLTGLAVLAWQLGVNWALRDTVNDLVVGNPETYTNWSVVAIAIAMILGGAMFANL